MERDNQRKLAHLGIQGEHVIDTPTDNVGVFFISLLLLSIQPHKHLFLGFKTSEFFLHHGTFRFIAFPERL